MEKSLGGLKDVGFFISFIVNVIEEFAVITADGRVIYIDDEVFSPQFREAFTVGENNEQVDDIDGVISIGKVNRITLDCTIYDYCFIVNVYDVKSLFLSLSL